MRVQFFADPPAGDAVAEKLAALSGVEVEYVRNPHPHRIDVRSGVGFVVGMNLHGMGATVKEKARKVGARFVTVPPNWSGARTALEDAGFFVLLTKEQESREPAQPINTEPQGPGRARTWLERPEVEAKAAEAVATLDNDRAVAREAEKAAVEQAAQAEQARPATTETVTAVVTAMRTGCTVNQAERLAQATAAQRKVRDVRFAWFVDYLRHNPFITRPKMIRVLRRRFGIGMSNDRITEAKHEAARLGALPPTPEFPIDPEAIPSVSESAEDTIMDAARMSRPETLLPDTEAAANLLRESLLREAGLASFSLTLRDGKIEVTWERAVTTTRSGKLTL